MLIYISLFGYDAQFSLRRQDDDVLLEEDLEEDVDELEDEEEEEDLEHEDLTAEHDMDLTAPAIETRVGFHKG